MMKKRLDLCVAEHYEKSKPQYNLKSEYPATRETKKNQIASELTQSQNKAITVAVVAAMTTTGCVNTTTHFPYRRTTKGLVNGTT